MAFDIFVGKAPSGLVLPNIIDQYVVARMLWEKIGLSFTQLQTMPAAQVHALCAVHRAAMSAQNVKDAKK